ncbi:MAG: transposase, partial [Erysipelotrichaceae bacterium]|nr:transposase [Erysipelotrichaceae bacterium]
MASKGQKFNKYPEEFKEALKAAYLNGEATSNSIASDYGVPIKTAKNWVALWNNPEKYGSKGLKRGRPRDSEVDWKERYEI